MAGKYTDTHPQFTVFVNGSFAPAADGEVEFFTVGNTGIGNRKDTYSDPALTIPNPNPVPLDGFGRSINPIFLLGSYNTVIRDSEGNQLDEVDNVSGPTDAEGVPSQVVDLAADLKPIDTTDFQSVYVLGTTVIGDGGQGHFYFSSTSTESDNGVDIIEPDVGGGRWLLQNNAHNSIYSQDASGTTDVFTIAPTPGVIDLDGSRVYFVRSLGPNTLSSPTFQVGTSAAKNLRRHDVAVLQIGDTGPSGYEMILKLRTNESAYTLLNPYINIDGQFLVNSINADKLVNQTVDTLQLTNGAATNLKLDNMGASTVKANLSGGSAVPSDEPLTTFKSALNITAGDVSGLGPFAPSTKTTIVNTDLVNNNINYEKLVNLTGPGVLGRNSAGSVTELLLQTNMVNSDAITYDKIQNVVNDQRILGNVAGAGGIVSELTLQNILTFLGVSGSVAAESINIVIPITDSVSIRISGGHQDINLTDTVNFPTTFGAVPIVMFQLLGSGDNIMTDTVTTTGFGTASASVSLRPIYYLAIGLA